MIKIDKHISIVDPYPSIYINDEDLLIITDTHLGLEEHREKLGISIPLSITDKIIEYIVNSIKEANCKRVIILGDVKHEFGKPSSEEWFSVRKLIKSLRALNVEPEVVRGNHDNYIINILKGMNVKFHDPYLINDKYFFMHGHLDLEDKFNNANYIFLGHEHPAITIKDDFVKHRFKSFLIGEINNKKVIVLPSISPLAYGNPVNEYNNELLSILLRRHGIDEFIPYLIEIGKIVKEFPKIKFLRI